MTVRINGLTRIKSQALVNFPPTPSLNLDFTTPYVNGLNPLPSTVTFSRADAGAYATHVGPDGLVRRAAHNLLTYSETFNNSSVWTVVSASVSQNVITAPNGSLTASKIVEANTTGGHNFDRAGTYTINDGVVYTFSFYIKYGGRRYITFGGTNNPFIPNLGGMIDTLNGTVVSGNVRLQNVGDGWYRIISSFIGNGTGTGSWANIRFSFYATSDVNGWNYTGDGTSGFYIWGAQLEQNITPSYYVPTTSAAVYSTPRFDYDPVTIQPKGLLIEEARTNILTRSNEFSSTGWTLANATVAQGVLSPDGTTNAWTFSETTTNGVHELYNSMGSAPEPPYSWSIYAKAGTSRYICIWVSSGAVVKVDLQTGTILGVVAGTGFSDTPTSEIYSAGNGWYRIVYHTTRTAAQYNGIPGIGLTNNGNITSGSYNPYAGNTGNNVLIAFGQFEAGSFATSYIPTVASSVTRAADVAAAAGAAQTLLAAASCTTLSETSNISPQNCAFFADGSFNIFTSNYLAFLNNTQVAAKNITAFTLPSGSFADIQRVALAWSATGSSLSASGSTVATGAAYSTPGQMYFGSNGGTTGSTYFINGYMRRFIIYDFRMPDSKLPILTKG